MRGTMKAPKCDYAAMAGDVVGSASGSAATILAEILDEIKSKVMMGESIAPSDFEPNRRPAFWAAIRSARDDLPNLKPGWRTIEERHVDGIRVRERVYRLRGA